MQKMPRIWLPATVAFVTFILVSPGTCAADEGASTASANIDSNVGALNVADIHFLPRSLSEFGDRKACVIIFTSLDRPIAKRSLPTLKKFEEKYRDKGVQFVAINTDPAAEMVDVANQAVRADLHFPVRQDFSGDASRTVGVRRTPERVMIDSNMILRCRGRIDAKFRLSGVQQGNVRRDRREAIDDVLAGRDVAVAETPVDGCLITIRRQTSSQDMCLAAIRGCWIPGLDFAFQPVRSSGCSCTTSRREKRNRIRRLLGSCLPKKQFKSSCNIFSATQLASQFLHTTVITKSQPPRHFTSTGRALACTATCTCEERT